MEPLQELQIILVLTFNQPLDFDILINPKFSETLLEEFVVVDELVLGFGFEVEFGRGDAAGVEGVEDLAVGDAGAELLDFGEGGVGEGVDPGEQLAAGELGVGELRGDVVSEHLKLRICYYGIGRGR